MKDRLKKSTLKVLGYSFVHGESLLKDLKKNSERCYPLYGVVDYKIYTNQGTLHVTTLSPFAFDGRSGPKLVDWYVPNLGSFEEILCWLTHDANAYGKDLSFKDTNVLLYAMLRDLPKYRPTKATVIQLAVSVDSSWYGEPKPTDWCYANRGLVFTEWLPPLV
jgi:hypothetical protein